MKERVKVFTFVTGHGEAIIASPLEDHINQWLTQTKGRVTHISQSESERPGNGHHVTITIWYETEG
jgi:hypothetical protein